MAENKTLQDWALKLWRALVKKASDMRSDSKTFVMIVCLLISTLFWFLKALNDEYSTEVEFPIEFSNVPKNYSLYGKPPDKLVATIEDAGFTIIRYKFSFVFSSLKFDVSKHFKQKEKEEKDGSISLSRAALVKGIESELLSSTKIVNVYPDDIAISYSKLQERMLPVKVMAEISTETQHIVNGNIITQPDSVLVIGSGLQLAETEAVYTQAVRAHHLDDTLIRSVGLQSVEGLDFQKRKVKLIIPVETYTEKILEVPVMGLNFPDSLGIRTFPGVATVSCICGLSVYSQVHPYDFKCYIDYKDVEAKNNGQTEVKVVSNNKYAKRVILRTQEVDYLIEKKW